jgi:hypothetical protein
MGPNKAMQVSLHYIVVAGLLAEKWKKKTDDHWLIADASNAYMVQVRGQFINAVLEVFILVPFQFRDQVLQCQIKDNKKGRSTVIQSVWRKQATGL